MFFFVFLSLAQAIKTPLDVRFCAKNLIVVEQTQLSNGFAHGILALIEY